MGNLLAGAAMRKITPSMELLERIGKEMEAAQGKHEGVFDGIHEDIYVRAIVLSDGEKKVVLGSSDLGSFPGQYKMNKRLVEEYGIEPYGCLLGCTHNHEGIHGNFGSEEDPGFREKPAPTPAITEFSNMVHDMMAEAVGEAIEKLQPARIGASKGMSYINACRDLPTPCGGIQLNNFHGPSDHELIVIKVENLKGEIIGMLVNHATHSNALVWNVYDGSYPKIGSDIGGGVSRFVEKAHQNKFPCLWVIGAAGDQNPIVRSTWRSIVVNDEGKFEWIQTIFHWEDNYAQMQALCATQGLEVLELEKNMTEFTDEFSFEGAETSRDAATRQSYASLGLYFERNYGPDVIKQILPGERPEPIPHEKPTLTHRFHLFQVCGIAFAGSNCEPYTNLGIMVKNMVPCDTVVFSGLCYGGIGYIPDAEGEKFNGFGTSLSNARSGAETEAVYKDGFSELIDKVFNK